MAMERFWRGATWGAIATVVMSVLMLIGMVSGMSPMPMPIPAAIVGKLLGPSTAKPVIMGLAILSHLGYGAFFGGAFALVTRRVRVWAGVGLGVGLWLLMQVVVLPFLGWGVFGSGLSSKIAVATLVLHLVYGASYGALMGRHQPPPSAASPSARSTA